MPGPPPLGKVEPLCVRLFGTPHVTYAGKPVRFIAARTMPLFAYLLLGRDRPIARDQLAFKFWPDSSETEARANLRRHLYRINAPLEELSGHRWFEATNNAVTVDPRMPVDLDVARLEAAAADQRGATSVVDLYTGDLYEACDDEWLVPHRERLRATFLHILIGLIDRYRGERRFPEALALARKALQVDPFREDAVRTLMSLHYESGDRSSALAEYQTFRERLQLEMGADPMHETLSLHDAIRRHAPIDERQAGRAPADRPATEPAMPFEGRGDDIDTLRAAWRQAAEGRSRVVFVCGEAGIGKTRLLREFATLAEREGARVLWGGSSAPEAEPYEPVTEALAGAISEIARLSLAPPLLGALATRFPELRAARPNLPETAPLVDDRERERFFDAVAFAIERLCAARPTVLVLEDVHWVLADTFDLIARIVRTCPGARLCLVLSFRDDQSSAPMRTFRLNPALKRAVRLGLARLEPAACREILRGAYETLPAGVGDWAIDLAKGNPLFLSELIREYDPSGDAPRVRSLPTSLESAILARLANLREAARSLLDIAAVGGTIVSLDVLQHASGWPLAELLDATDDLVDRFVLRETATGSRGDYQFAHELIRDAVLRAMPQELRARRHRRFAKTLLALFPARQDEYARVLAQHFEAAGEVGDAARFYARAAHGAHAQFAWHDAIVLAERALDLERGPRERFSLYATIEAAAAKAGDRERRRVAVAALLELASAVADDRLRADALVRSGVLGYETADYDRQRRAADDLESIARANDDPVLRRAALRCRARAEIAAGRFTDAAAAIGAIDAIAALDRTVSEHVDDLRVLSFAHANALAFDAARAAVDEAERRAGPEPALADRVTIVRAKTTLALEASDRAEVIRLSPVELELCETIGDVEGAGSAHQTAARVAWWAFDVTRAREHLRAAAAIFERIGKPQSRASIAINAGAIENEVGLLDRAERFYREALGFAEHFERSTLRTLCYGNLAYAALLREDGAGALTHAERALSLARAAGDARLTAINLGHFGSALWLIDRGDPGRSEAPFTEAFEICAVYDLGDDRREILAQALPTFASCGRLEQALSFAAELERSIAADPSAVVLPVDALARASDVYDAAGDHEEARVLRDRARTLLHERLEKLPDEGTRAAYAALRCHRPLLGTNDVSACSPTDGS